MGLLNITDVRVLVGENLEPGSPFQAMISNTWTDADFEELAINANWSRCMILDYLTEREEQYYNYLDERYE